jgi:O-methyltransferase involved in polyketide biosynthesis
MGLRRWIKRLERGASEDLASFVLADGSRYYFNPTSAEIFLHSMDCLRAQGSAAGEPFPEPPETVKAIARARDRGAALSQLYPNGSFGIFPYEVEALLERGQLVPRSLVAGRELGEPLEDLSEP